MKTYRILNLGDGVQSTALYLMSLRQDEPEHVPVFDYAIFADTQDEPQAVYEHLAWLKSLGGPPILTDTAGQLSSHLTRGVHSTGQRFASIPAFTKADDTNQEGRLKRQCTKEYKTSVVERVIRYQVLGLKRRARFPRDIHIQQYMGLSFDEPGRIIKVQARYLKISWATPRFPLFEMQWNRGDCLAYLAEVAPDRKVPRSACTFCPCHSNAEWRDLRDNSPEEWARACEIDDTLRRPGVIANRGLKAPMFLHRSCKPLREAPIDTPESRGEQYTFGFASECEGMCGL